jgi:hypothetical protein
MIMFFAGGACCIGAVSVADDHEQKTPGHGIWAAQIEET